MDLFHKVERIIHFLLQRGGFNTPNFNLKLTKGPRGGYFCLEDCELAIPEWSLHTNFHGCSDDTFCYYYVAHELAHAVVGGYEEIDHGALFYDAFRQLCPIHLQHWELEYLPDNRSFLSVQTGRLPVSIR